MPASRSTARPAGSVAGIVRPRYWSTCQLPMAQAGAAAGRAAGTPARGSGRGGLPVAREAARAGPILALEVVLAEDDEGARGELAPPFVPCLEAAEAREPVPETGLAEGDRLTPPFRQRRVEERHAREGP